MGLLECASGASVRKGYDYYKEKKIITLEEIFSNIYLAKVKGSSNEPYSVELHIDHPRKSKCNCPHAEGKRIICNHIVAAYFTVFPNEAEKFYMDVMAYQVEEENRQKELDDRVYHYVRHMKKEELQQTLLQLLFNGPEWQMDQFIWENGIDDDL